MIELTINQRRRNLGSFEVGRVLPFAKRRIHCDSTGVERPIRPSEMNWMIACSGVSH